MAAAARSLSRAMPIAQVSNSASSTRSRTSVGLIAASLARLLPRPGLQAGPECGSRQRVPGGGTGNQDQRDQGHDANTFSVGAAPDRKTEQHQPGTQCIALGDRMHTRVEIGEAQQAHRADEKEGGACNHEEAGEQRVQSSQHHCLQAPFSRPVSSRRLATSVTVKLNSPYTNATSSQMPCSRARPTSTRTTMD